MKILAFTDLHARVAVLKSLQKKSKDVDIVVCCGDFTIFEEGIDLVIPLLDDFYAPVLLIHGNHEDPELVKGLCARHENLTFIHRKVHEINGYKFVGHGGGGFNNRDKSFESFAKKVEVRKKMILVTHQPPFGTKLDHLWEHRGNESYREFILKFKPLLALCGHLHENEGKEDKIGRTRIINPGPKGKVIEV